MTSHSAQTSKSPAAVAPAAGEHPPHNGLRETIESIVIAFVLAFLFRTFQAEAFVIPTGSMATTLLGMHKDMPCAKCQFPYRVGVPEDHPTRGSGRCPNCGYVMHFGPALPEPPSYNGDRILVTKSLYELEDPQRWDVAVFKFPAAAYTSYIKRLVGLPNETLRILGGDIYTRPNDASPLTPFAIERKPPHKIVSMLQMVYDNDYALPWLIDRGWPARWYSPDDSWLPLDDYRSFATSGEQPESWLRYRHLVPDERDWQLLTLRPLTRDETAQLRPSLIPDSYAYNEDYRPTSINLSARLPSGLNWTSDLAIECELQSESATGQVVFELVKGNLRYRCQIDLATGGALLTAEGFPELRAQGITSVRGAGKHRVRFANVDQQLHLWVDDALISFDAETTYTLVTPPLAGELDYSPAAVASLGAKLRVNHLQLWRDVYYVADRYGSRKSGATSDSAAGEEFRLEAGQFFALGDNSPASSDSRLWDAQTPDGKPEQYVTRELLIGKAMFVYWPRASKYARVPVIGFDVPVVPNFSRMRLIH